MKSHVAIAVERERQQIASEIHDGLLPYLYATAAKLSQLRRGDDELNQTLKDAADWVDRSRQIARDLMNSIAYPEAVRHDPLRAARDFLDEVLVQSGQAVAGEQAGNLPADQSAPDYQEVDLAFVEITSRPRIDWPCLQGDPPESALAGHLDEPTSVAVYRIVGELVRNAVRHANATQITIQAEQTDRRVRIKVRDDGCGFDPNSLDETARHGLDWVHGRAEWVGWELRIDSASGRGTTAILSGPTRP